MGIQGLLPMLKEIQVGGHISHFKGKTLAVDVSSHSASLVDVDPRHMCGCTKARSDVPKTS